MLLGLLVLAGLSGRLIDFPTVAGGFKADEATYVLQTFSVAEDFDLKYERRDLLRFGRLYGTGRGGEPIGPNGIFLKQSPHSTDQRLDFAKAMAYPIFAAPFAKLGGLGGMFMFNVVLLIGCAWCAAVFAAARVGSTWGWAIGFFFIAASSAPIWSVWLMPEVFNFALVFFAYFLWLYKEVRRPEPVRDGFLFSVWSDVAAAALLGIAAYSKPTNATLIAPFVVVALWKRCPSRAAVTAAVFIASVGGWFGATYLVTGEWNYQGGNRKTFYGHYPFGADGSTFAVAQNSNGMTTGGAKGISSDILFPGHPRFWSLLGNNAGYFFWGRDSGLIPYFFPGALLLAIWLARIRRAEFWQVCIVAAAAGTAVIMLFWWPYTWNGAGGPPGNRYYLSVYPLLFFLLPLQAGAWTAIASGIGGMAFLWPLFGHPFLASKEPWLAPATTPLRLLPVERTMMNEIPERLYPERYKIPFGDPRNSFLYVMDGNTYHGEPFPEGFGFWIAGDASTEIIVATAWPRTHVRLAVSGPIANTFTANWGGHRCRMEIAPDKPQICELETADAVWAHDSFFYSLKMSTTAGFVPAIAHPPATDARNLGVKVVPIFSEK